MPHTIRRYIYYLFKITNVTRLFPGISPPEMHFSMHTNDIPGYYSDCIQTNHFSFNFHSTISTLMYIDNCRRFFSSCSAKIFANFALKNAYFVLLWRTWGNESTVIIQCFVGNWCGTEDKSLNIDDDVDYCYIHSSFSTHFNIRATKTYLFWRMKWISLKIEKKCRIDNNDGSSCFLLRFLHFYLLFIEWIHNSKKSTCAFNP